MFSSASFYFGSAYGLVPCLGLSTHSVSAIEWLKVIQTGKSTGTSSRVFEKPQRLVCVVQ